jgi:hypothetical protein
LCLFSRHTERHYAVLERIPGFQNDFPALFGHPGRKQRQRPADTPRRKTDNHIASPVKLQAGNADEATQPSATKVDRLIGLGQNVFLVKSRNSLIKEGDRQLQPSNRNYFCLHIPLSSSRFQRMTPAFCAPRHCPGTGREHQGHSDELTEKPLLLLTNKDDLP